MAGEPCDKRIAIQNVGSEGAGRPGLVLRNTGDGRLALSRDCCCGVCWNARIEITRTDGTLMVVHYPIVPCLDGDGNPRSCNQVGAYDYEGYTDTYHHQHSDGTMSSALSAFPSDVVRPFPMIDEEPSDYQEIQGKKALGVRHDKGYVDRYSWGCEINVDGSMGYWGGTEDADAFANVVGQSTYSSNPMTTGHIGMDFGVTVKESQLGGKPARDARLFVHVGTLIHTLFGTDPCTTIMTDAGPMVVERTICNGYGGSRPVAIHERPSACILNTGITDAEGNIQILKMTREKDASGRVVEKPTPETLALLARHNETVDSWGEYLGGPPPYTRYHPTHSSCYFYALGTDWSPIYIQTKYDTVDQYGPWSVAAGEDLITMMMNPPEGFFDVRAAFDFEPVSDSEYWLANALPTVTIGKSVFKLDEEMFRLINDGGAGQDWAELWAGPDRFADMPAIARSRLLLPATDLRVYSVPMRAVGGNIQIARVTITDWKRCSCGHSCLVNRDPPYVMRMHAHYDWFPAIINPPQCDGRKSFDFSAKSAPQGKCLQYDPATGECGKYKTASFDCDACEDSVGAPFEI